MNKTWKSQVGGILAIVGGVIGLLGCMGLLIAITVLGTVWQWGLMPVNVIGILWIILVPMFICGAPGDCRRCLCGAAKKLRHGADRCHRSPFPRRNIRIGRNRFYRHIAR
jgi:hypothetical protein